MELLTLSAKEANRLEVLQRMDEKRPPRPVPAGLAQAWLAGSLYPAPGRLY